MGIVKWMQQVEMRLAAGLLRLGVSRHLPLFNFFYQLMPALVCLAVTLEELHRPSNGFFWYYGPQEPEDDLDGMVADVSEIINRARTPLGQDDYIILVLRLEALPGDEAGLTPERIEDTLVRRRAVENCKLTGNRWAKWKNGDGRQELLSVLQGAAPTPLAPVTMIQAAVLGMISERLYARFKKT